MKEKKTKKENNGMQGWVCPKHEWIACCDNFGSNWLQCCVCNQKKDVIEAKDIEKEYNEKRDFGYFLSRFLSGKLGKKDEGYASQKDYEESQGLI